MNFYKYPKTLILAQAFGITLIALLFVVTFNYWGGMNWNDNNTLFNFHPFFMVLGMIYLYGNAIIIYQCLRSLPHFLVKVIHAVLHLINMTFTIVALVAIFKLHKNHLDNLHAWIGIAVVIAYFLQWFYSFAIFMLPYASESMRAKGLVVHKYFGIIVFIGALIAVISGICLTNEKKDLDVGGKMASSLGVFILLFGACIVYAATRRGYGHFSQSDDDYEYN